MVNIYFLLIDEQFQLKNREILQLTDHKYYTKKIEFFKMNQGKIVTRMDLYCRFNNMISY